MKLAFPILFSFHTNGILWLVQLAERSSRTWRGTFSIPSLPTLELEIPVGERKEKLHRHRILDADAAQCKIPLKCNWTSPIQAYLTPQIESRGNLETFLKSKGFNWQKIPWRFLKKSSFLSISRKPHLVTLQNKQNKRFDPSFKLKYSKIIHCGSQL